MYMYYGNRQIYVSVSVWTYINASTIMKRSDIHHINGLYCINIYYIPVYIYIYSERAVHQMGIYRQKKKGRVFISQENITLLIDLSRAIGADVLVQVILLECVQYPLRYLLYFSPQPAS